MDFCFSPSIESNNVSNMTSVILGNETRCQNKSVTEIPCNGPLIPSTSYKYILSFFFQFLFENKYK